MWLYLGFRLTDVYDLGKEAEDVMLEYPSSTNETIGCRDNPMIRKVGKPWHHWATGTLVDAFQI
jgi:hypothetical protein